MNSTAAMGASSANFSKAFLAIFWGGLACGVLDITQAWVAWGIRGVAPVRILQSIASGLLGPKAFQGGAGIAALGLFLHFFIAFTAAAIYYAASRNIAFMTQRAVLSGMLYGEMVFLFMNYVVLPLSAIHRFPTYTMPLIITGPIGHLFLVGLPIALAVRKFS